MDFNIEQMVAEVKKNLQKVEEEGQVETQLVFTSPKAASDVFYKIVEELKGWSIKSCESRHVPTHYQNTCILSKDDEDEEVTTTDA